MKLLRIILLIVCFVSLNNFLFGQDEKKELANTSLLHPPADSLRKKEPKKETVIKKKHDPHIATLRSAILPGWGQAYNREYWKIPIVYGALAIPAIAYVYNNTWYKRTRDAYAIRIAMDTARFPDIYPALKNLDASSLQTYRNSFRRDRDYSILWFLILWGLNVADATVFGHLKDFNVSNDLSMHVGPSFNPATRTPGINLVLNLRNNSPHPKNIAR